MIDLSLLNETTEILANNFTPSEIDDLGILLYKGYDGHKAAGIKNHITLSSRKAANALVQSMNLNNKTFQLIKLIIEMDGSSLNGKSISINGLEAFLNKLIKSDIYYDFKKRKLFSSKKDALSMINWGSLREGKIYNITIMSLDIVKNSKLVKKYGTKTIDKVYFHLRTFVEQKILEYNGRIWNFAGDGGLIAFTFKDHITRSVLCALDIRASLSVFNIRPDLPIGDEILLRLALDTGKIKFSFNTGHIISDVINYAAHLEKLGTLPGEIAISKNVMDELHPKISKIFKDENVFENMSCYSTI